MPNNAFKPKPLRSTNLMADKACHVVGSTTQLGLTWVLGLAKACEYSRDRSRPRQSKAADEAVRAAQSDIYWTGIMVRGN